jgi:hypothetical protein
MRDERERERRATRGRDFFLREAAPLKINPSITNTSPGRSRKLSGEVRETPRLNSHPTDRNYPKEKINLSRLEASERLLV